MDVDMTVNIGVDFDFDAAAPKGCMVSGCSEPTAVPKGGFCRKHGDEWAAQPHVKAVFQRWADKEDAQIVEKFFESAEKQAAP